MDERWANKPYGTDNIGGYGCGPTSMSIVVSSLTDDIVDPVEMAEWAYKNGGWCSKSGSYHSLIPNAAKAWGLNVEGCTASEPDTLPPAGTSLSFGVCRTDRFWWLTLPATGGARSCGICPSF